MRCAFALEIRQERHAARPDLDTRGLLVEQRGCRVRIRELARELFTIPVERATRREHHAHHVPHAWRDVAEGVRPQPWIDARFPHGRQHSSRRAPTRYHLARRHCTHPGRAAGVVSPTADDGGAAGQCREPGSVVADAAQHLGRAADVRQERARHADGLENLVAPAKVRRVVHQGRRCIRRVGRQRSREPIADVVLRQQHRCQAFVGRGLVPAQPEHLRQREALERRIAREIAQPLFTANALRDLGALGRGPSVAPQERWADHPSAAIEEHRRMHLPRDADGGDRYAGIVAKHRTDGCERRLPPRRRVLLRPPRSRRLKREGCGRGGNERAVERNEDRLHAAGTDVQAEKELPLHVSERRGGVPS